MDPLIDGILYCLARLTIQLAAMLNNARQMAPLGLRQIKRSSTKGWCLLAIDHHVDDEVAIMHLCEVVLFKLWLKLLGKNRAVVWRDAEANHRPDVAKDRITHRWLHLRDILISHGEVKPILACLTQDSGKAISCEVLELIDIEIKWPPVMDIEDIATTHRRQLDLRN